MAWAATLSMYRPPSFDWKKSFQFSLLRDDIPDKSNIYPPCLGQSWDALDEESVQKRHQYSFQNVLLMDVANSSALLSHLGEYLQKKVHIVAPQAEEVAQKVENSTQRILFFAKGTYAQELFSLLHKHPGMRDVLYGVVILDPIWDEEWMAKHFGQDELDTEANSPVPYIFCFSEKEKEVQEPKESVTGWQSIRKIEIGVISQEKNSKIGAAFASLLGALYS